MLVKRYRYPLFVPSWVVDTINRQSGKLSDILDLNTLSEHLSGEDVACIAALNKNSMRYFGFQNEDAIYSAWISGKESDTYHNHVEPMLAMVSRTLEARLIDDDTLSGVEPFEIKDISSDCFLVIVNPGHFGPSNSAVSKGLLVRELLKLFYAYDGFDAVTNNRLFDVYFESLVSSNRG